MFHYHNRSTDSCGGLTPEVGWNHKKNENVIKIYFLKNTKYFDSFLLNSTDCLNCWNLSLSIVTIASIAVSLVAMMVMSMVSWFWLGLCVSLTIVVSTICSALALMVMMLVMAGLGHDGPNTNKSEDSEEFHVDSLGFSTELPTWWWWPCFILGTIYNVLSTNVSLSLCLSVTSSLDLSHILQSIKVLIIYKNTSTVYSLQTTPSYQQCSKHNLAVGQTFVSHHHHLRVDQIKARFITWNVLFLYSVFLMSAGV